MVKYFQFKDHGKNVGYNYYFDSLGSLKVKDYYYYDLKVGPTIRYNGSDPISYNFYAFDNNLTYGLYYDSLKDHILVDLGTNFFHIIKYDTADYYEGNKNSTGLDYCIYLLNPPKYNFNYSLVLTDSGYKNVKVIDSLKSKFPFRFFSIPTQRPDQNYFYAIRLLVSDSLTTKNEYLMFKKLK